MISHRIRILLALIISSLGLVESDASAYSYYAITGVHTGIDPTTGARPARLPIQVMQQSYPKILLVLQIVMGTVADQSLQ